MVGERVTTVLVVDDQKDVADLYEAMLEEELDVRKAYSGKEALEKLDEDVDVVLLDRKMPGLSGDEVLEEIRGRGLDIRVAMVTAVLPDFDILEMGFDDYVVKPVRRQDLIDTVEKMVDRSSYDEQVREYFSMLSKRAALQEEKSEVELEENPEYQELESRIGEMSESLDEALLGVVEEEGYGSAFRDLGD